MSYLIIAGAYFKTDENTIVMPYYSGQYSFVECDVYLTQEKLLQKYDLSWFKKNYTTLKDFSLHIDRDVFYLSASQELCKITQDWDLLSDISNYHHVEDYTFFDAPKNILDNFYIGDCVKNNIDNSTGKIVKINFDNDTVTVKNKRKTHIYKKEELFFLNIE